MSPRGATTSVGHGGIVNAASIVAGPCSRPLSGESSDMPKRKTGRRAALSKKSEPLLRCLSVLGLRQLCHAFLHVAVHRFNHTDHKRIDALWLAGSVFEPSLNLR